MNSKGNSVIIAKLDVPFQVCNPIPRQVCKEVPDVDRVEKVCQPTETEQCREVPREVCRPERDCTVVERSRDQLY